MPSVAGPEIERLIQLLARLPGLGPRSARRAALHLIKKREPLMAPLASALQTAMEEIVVCGPGGSIDTQNPCTVCVDPKRDPSVIVVVADVADLWALERAGAINARYHVLGGTLPPPGRGGGPARSTRAPPCSAPPSRRSTASARRTSASMRWSRARMTPP